MNEKLEEEPESIFGTPSIPPADTSASEDDSENAGDRIGRKINDFASRHHDMAVPGKIDNKALYMLSAALGVPIGEFVELAKAPREGIVGILQGIQAALKLADDIYMMLLTAYELGVAHGMGEAILDDDDAAAMEGLMADLCSTKLH